MKRWEIEAIRLKYNGRTHRDIADEVSRLTGINVTEGTMRNYFAVDGRLYIPYLQYEAEHNRMSDDEMRSALKRDAQHGIKILQSLLQAAIKDHQYQVALNIVKEQMDRSGLVTIRKSEINVKEETGKEMTREQFLKECARMGIDPGSGLRIPTPKVEPN